MSKLLLLYGYNNYFNRIIKKKTTLAEYKEEVGTGNYVELNNTNFNITDGVNARHVFNVSSTLDEKSPDYLIREKTDGTLERWFVLESVKIMGNQIQVTLRRDIIADFYSQISTAKAFIKKGMLNYNSPLIFNKENMTYNQIKTKELLLKDNTKIPWIIGYIARNDNQGEVLEKDITIESEPPQYATPFEDLPTVLKNIINNNITEVNGNNIDYTLMVHHISRGNINQPTAKREIVSVSSLYSSFTQQHSTTAEIISESDADNIHKAFPDIRTAYVEEVPGLVERCLTSEGYYAKFNSKLNEIYQSETINLVENNFMIYNGLYYTKNNKLYKLSIRKSDNVEFEKNYNATNLTDNLGTEISNFLSELVGFYGFNANDINEDVNFIAMIGLHKKYFITITEEYYASATTRIPATRNQLYDAPYDMIAIPWGTEENPGIDFGNYTSQKEYALAAARSIALALTNSYCYDFQILPYCPIKQIRDEGEIDLTGLVEHKDYEYIKSSNVPVNIIMFCKKSSGSFDIELDTTDYEELEEKTNAIEKKVASETNMIRFVSPNFGSIYEINAQKNEGISVINVDYNYKPYQPYIHLSPIFKGLYGQDFNDPKGLILSGDFSIATTSSKWEEYQLQNKNYNLIFDRQIENLDVNNTITLEQTETMAKINTATAVFSGAAGGGLAGSAFGPIGAGVGAAVGALGSGITSAIGAKKDIEYLVRQQTENRDYAVDMYQYQLGNIKALPNTLNKVSAYNENNKIFPFIEIYDCTDIEKQNLRDKIKYNGMTVMVEGTIGEYVVNAGDYIQAELIRLEGLYEDNHLIVEIYNELMRGVYIYA